MSTSNRTKSSISLERLKEKIDGVTTNIAIYEDHLKRYKKELKQDYDLTVGEAEDRLEEIEEETKKLAKKERKLHKEASAILDAIEDED